MRRFLWPVAALALALAGCSGGGDESATSTSASGDPGTFDGVAFAVDETDDGARLRIEVGDEVVARLAVAHRASPPWRVSVIPDRRILTTSDRLRFVPSEPDGPEPYDEFTFRAVGPGTTRIGFSHPGSGGALAVTVIVEDA